MLIKAMLIHPDETEFVLETVLDKVKRQTKEKIDIVTVVYVVVQQSIE